MIASHMQPKWSEFGGKHLHLGMGQNDQQPRLKMLYPPVSSVTWLAEGKSTSNSSMILPASKAPR